VRGYVEITKDAAKEAARAGAFTIGEDYDGAGRVILHSLLSGWIGADWDLDAVLALIDAAHVVCWQDGIAHHDLCVVADDPKQAAGGRLQYNFDVRRPADVLPAAVTS